MAEEGTSQDPERKQLSKAHSPTRDGRGRDKSGHGKKVTKQGALTDWRWQGEGQVRTWKESDQVMCTHKLEMGEGGTSQDTERKQLSKAHSLPGDGRERDKSGQGKKVTKQGTLTNWRWQREGQVRTRKENDQARHAHRLEMAEGGTSQGKKRKQPSKEHSQTGDGRGRDKSGHRNKVTKQGTLTNWRWEREGQVRTWKESNQARHTHQLEMAEGGTSQDKERKQPSKAHSLPGDGRERDKSEQGKKVTKQGALTNWRWEREGQVRTWKESDQEGTLTNWRWQREGQVRTQKESDQARSTHQLEMAEGGTSQDKERK